MCLNQTNVFSGQNFNTIIMGIRERMKEDFYQMVKKSPQGHSTWKRTKHTQNLKINNDLLGTEELYILL